MNLFIFFALPLATILLAIILQKILNSPILVAITFFAIYLIVAFVAFIDTLAEALIAAILYTIISYITAYIVMIICKFKQRFCDCIGGETSNCGREEISGVRKFSCNNDDNTQNNLLRISCSCGESDRSRDLPTVDSSCSSNVTNNCNEETETISNENIVPNNQYVNRTANYINRRCYRRV